MKVALLHGFVGGRAGGGGGVRQMLELARGLGALGHEPVICAYQFEPGTIDPEIESAFEIRAVETGPISHPRNALALQKTKWVEMWRQSKIVPSDVDVINAHESPVYMAAWYEHVLHKTPTVWTRNDAQLYEMVTMPQESWTPAPSPLLGLAYRTAGQTDRLAIRAMDAICVLDERNARMVKEAYGRDARIIRSGAAPRFFEAPSRAEARAQLGIDPDELAVLSVGILMPHRRHEDTVQAIGLLREGDRPVKLRVIGSDHLSPETGAALREFAAASGHAERVELIQTAVSESDLIAHFAAADVFVFANDRQTWGLAPLEAIAAKTPVVVSRGAGVHEVLTGRKGVELVDPRAPEQIAAAIERIRGDAGEYDVTETRAWSRVALSAEAYAGHMADLFAEVSRQR